MLLISTSRHGMIYYNEISSDVIQTTTHYAHAAIHQNLNFTVP